MLLTAEEEAILLADLPTLPDEFALPLPPPPAESSETELDLLALQLEDERLRKVMEARLCSFEADRAELREMMTSAADSSGGGADAAELEEDAGRAARQRALDEALRHAQAELDAWEPDVNSLIDPTATEMGGAASGGPSSLGRSSRGEYERRPGRGSVRGGLVGALCSSLVATVGSAGATKGLDRQFRRRRGSRD